MNSKNKFNIALLVRITEVWTPFLYKIKYRDRYSQTPVQLQILCKKIIQK